MARKRLSVRKTRQVFRLKWEGCFSNRAIARACKIGRATVRDYLDRAEKAGLSWTQVEQMNEADLEDALFPKAADRSKGKITPDWSYINQELKRKGVTLRLLWQECYQSNPQAAYSYSQFCNLYRSWSKKLSPVMAQSYKGGELLFVDYAGLTIPYVYRISGEQKKAQVFVAALGASSYTYAEAQKGQDLNSWISGHVNSFEYFGGIPEIVVPDNLKSGVTSPCYYEPDINPTYDDLSLHYGFAIIPARVRAPRDKAKVETAVQVIERWVLAPLRKRTFFSVDEINKSIELLLEEVNNRVMEHLEKSRRELFESVDRPALRPLPNRPYEYAERKSATVNINYHVTFNKHYYSVPYTLIGKPTEIRATANTVEVFYKGERVASHMRDNRPGKYSTKSSHMPSNHRRRIEKWSPDRFIRWAGKIGSHTCQAIQVLLSSKRHPEQAYKTCIGTLKLADKYSPERLEAACRTAIRFNLYSYRQIHNILKNKMDKREQDEINHRPTSVHEHVRGAQYYH